MEKTWQFFGQLPRSKHGAQKQSLKNVQFLKTVFAYFAQPQPLDSVNWKWHFFKNPLHSFYKGGLTSKLISLLSFFFFFLLLNILNQFLIEQAIFFTLPDDHLKELIFYWQKCINKMKQWKLWNKKTPYWAWIRQFNILYTHLHLKFRHLQSSSSSSGSGRDLQARAINKYINK